jgi:hypothetical protein
MGNIWKRYMELYYRMVISWVINGNYGDLVEKYGKLWEIYGVVIHIV